ncbi:MAG: 16S rRNA (guanine(527)-N(7))-methyltransferase RsmG [Ideonella sp.]|nr:16S rRNA (guanine(527)-N(7))-methyltransferase RsmG [Ideonella sp.]
MPLEPGRALLSRAAAELGLPMSHVQIEQLLAYVALLVKWNRVYNLTAVRDPSDMLRQHVVDSLAALPPLMRHLSAGSGRILDVGSGAGLPGLVWAIAAPALSITCVDTVGKKASFMQQVVAELELPQARAVHGRVEDVSLGGFDVVTSRAFASLADFTTLTREHLGPTGAWLALKGRHPDDEIRALPAEIEVFHVEPLVVPGLDAERCLVWMRPRHR